MNSQIHDAEYLILTMQPSTLEAYRVSSGVDIPNHLKQHKKKIAQDKTLTVLLAIATFAGTLVAYFYLIPHDMPSRGALLVGGIAIAVILAIMSFVLSHTSYSMDLSDFIHMANKALPLRKAQTLAESFEEEVRRNLIEHRRHETRAVAELEAALGKQPEHVIANLLLRVEACQTHLSGVTMYANYFGITEH